MLLNIHFAKKHLVANLVEKTKRIYQTIVPRKIRITIAQYKQKRIFTQALVKAHEYFKQNKIEAEKYSRELEYMTIFKNDDVFPYHFTEKYVNYPVTVQKDPVHGLWFAMHNDKKLYFPRGWDKNLATAYYMQLLKEQDNLSPHRYMTETIYNKNPEILMDVGCAEGILTLDLIENLKKAVLFECDKHWIEALTLTFAPWKEKIVIINKYASDSIGDNKTTLDAVASDISDNIIVKLDVEGAEREVLAGTQELLKRNNVIFLCCTYHKQNDAVEFEQLLNKHGFKTEFSNGYMFFPFFESLQPPFFRRGLVRGWKDTPCSAR